MSVSSRKSSVSRFSLHNTNKPLRLSATTLRSASISSHKKYSESQISTTSTTTKRQDPKVTISSNIIHTNQSLSTFNDLNIPSSTRTISVSHNNLTNFNGFPSLSKLETLDVSFNPIESLLEIPILPSIKSINIDQTPFANTELCRISLIILFGGTLRKINGEGIKSSEIKVAKEFDKDCVHLIRAGWIATYPPPNQQEIVKIKKKLSKNLSSRNRKRKEVKPAITIRASEHQSAWCQRKIEAQNREMNQLLAEINRLEKRNAH